MSSSIFNFKLRQLRKNFVKEKINDTEKNI